ncbi:MAG TPA: alpha/beta hydrolase domain-containing protein [Candidatus Limnocylindria bacterium]|nr:alpha/beta hydrolase domain-containing protein [Candidatus Limnocylindria bacterium]
MPLRAVAALAALAVTLAVHAGAQVPSPTIEGPITSAGSAFVGGTTAFDLAEVGYEQAEYFISGTASAYVNTAPLGVDGRWSVEPGETAAYKTRIVVYRPSDPKKFRGTVFVEWLNVSGGVDAAPDWTQGHVEMIRQGAAWVGVSAQFVGVEGGPPLVGVISLPLKTVNPARYGSLHHPGDSFSLDIFSQAGMAVRAPSGPAPLGPLVPKRVIAIGESQSAFKLTQYVNAVHPLTHLYDGYLIHSRGGLPVSPLSQAPQPMIVPPGEAIIREDVDVPVLIFQTESDLTFLQYVRARQDDSRNVRLWEVAGTAHFDTYGLVVGPFDLGTSPDAAAVLSDVTAPIPGLLECELPINSGPQHWVLNAALSKLVRWVKTGKAPKPAPRLDVNMGPPVAFNVDEHGNTLGGIRTPWVDAPIATFAGMQPGSILCILFGSTTAFDEAKLAELYPTPKAFKKAHGKALKRAVKKGWILKPDAKLIKQWAAGSGIGG